MYPANIGTDIAVFMVGVVMLLFTRTFHFFSYVYPDNLFDEAFPYYGSSWFQHIIYFIRSVLSIVAQTLCWVSMWDLLEVQSGSVTASRNFNATAALINDFHKAEQTNRKLLKNGSHIIVNSCRNLPFHERGSVSFTGELINQGRFYQQLAYAGLGFAVLVATDSLVTNAWIKVDEEEEEGEEEDGEEEEEEADEDGGEGEEEEEEGEVVEKQKESDERGRRAASAASAASVASAARGLDAGGIAWNGNGHANAGDSRDDVGNNNDLASTNLDTLAMRNVMTPAAAAAAAARKNKEQRKSSASSRRSSVGGGDDQADENDEDDEDTALEVEGGEAKNYFCNCNCGLWIVWIVWIEICDDLCRLRFVMICVFFTLTPPPPDSFIFQQSWFTQGMPFDLWLMTWCRSFLSLIGQVRVRKIEGFIL